MSVQGDDATSCDSPRSHFCAREKESIKRRGEFFTELDCRKVIVNGVNITS